MYEIFARLLKEKGVKAFDVAKATGLRASLFTDWKMGRYKPKAEKRRIIADYFGVTLAYLDGESIYPNGEPMVREKPVKPSEINKIQVFNEIPNDMPLVSITNKRGEILTKNYNDGKMYWGLCVGDDSMAPKILTDDIVIFREEKNYNTDDICVLRSTKTEKAVIRKLVKSEDLIVFQPLNGEYDAYVFTNDDDFEILGVVVFSVHSYQRM